jgi:hypothetical protein
VRSRIVSRRSESKRPPNPWGPLFQPSAGGADPDLYIWSVWRERVPRHYGKAVTLSQSPTHEEVLRALINAGHIGGIGVTTAMGKYAVILKGGLPTTWIEVRDAYSGQAEFVLARERKRLTSTDPGVRKPNPWGPIFSQPSSPSGVGGGLWEVLTPADGYSRSLARIGLPSSTSVNKAHVLRALEDAGQITDRSGMDVDFDYVDDPDDPHISVDFPATKHGWKAVNRFLIVPARNPNPFGPIFSTGEAGRGGMTQYVWAIYSGPAWRGYTSSGTTLAVLKMPAVLVLDDFIDRLLPNPLDPPRSEYRLVPQQKPTACVYELHSKSARLAQRHPEVAYLYRYAVWNSAFDKEYINPHKLPVLRPPPRTPNPLGPIFEAGSPRPGEELHRWVVVQFRPRGGPSSSVLLPKHPTWAEIADAVGRDPKDVVAFHKFSSDDRRGVEFADLSYYELARVC